MARLTKSDRADLLERFRRYLRERRLPRTRQRDQVAMVVCRSDAHLSAADIQRELRDQDQAVGTATVYRTLELLVESGLARAHDFGDGFKRYEVMPTQQGHGHLICLRCNAVVEFTNEHLERLLPVISDEHAFLHRRHQIDIYGMCPECRKHDVEL